MINGNPSSVIVPLFSFDLLVPWYCLQCATRHSHRLQCLATVNAGKGFGGGLTKAYNEFGRRAGEAFLSFMQRMFGLVLGELAKLFPSLGSSSSTYYLLLTTYYLLLTTDY